MVAHFSTKPFVVAFSDSVFVPILFQYVPFAPHGQKGNIPNRHETFFLVSFIEYRHKHHLHRRSH
ncbi:ORF1340 [White spot syndrome virus]|uniref:Wsv437 n=3 Tax=White spot syndrome virus TaxID=342409 RepID=Q8VAH7_WSSVS|nr:wsv437 [Shrimp white spot syndrome virus]AFX59814.1 wsv437 [White spot syndrome virus]AAL33533.1 wsv437 [Shrimp white spot syndrome virus]AAL89365.1 WSSV497 [Shrimp white spot syndrome virus]ATU84124.1 ORF1340 [White spot syndrome virus]AWQ60561.1 wsv437 [Shrimp white spot syndrome virus]